MLKAKFSISWPLKPRNMPDQRRHWGPERRAGSQVGWRDGGRYETCTQERSRMVRRQLEFTQRTPLSSLRKI